MNNAKTVIKKITHWAGTNKGTRSGKAFLAACADVKVAPT